jgi:hypothetical protein
MPPKHKKSSSNLTMYLLIGGGIGGIVLIVVIIIIIMIVVANNNKKKDESTGINVNGGSTDGGINDGGDDGSSSSTPSHITPSTTGKLIRITFNSKNDPNRYKKTHGAVNPSPKGTPPNKVFYFRTYFLGTAVSSAYIGLEPDKSKGSLYSTSVTLTPSATDPTVYTPPLGTPFNIYDAASGITLYDRPKFGLSLIDSTTDTKDTDADLDNNQRFTIPLSKNNLENRLDHVMNFQKQPLNPSNFEFTEGNIIVLFWDTDPATEARLTNIEFVDPPAGYTPPLGSTISVDTSS